MDAAVHPHEVIDLSLDDDEALFHQYLSDVFPDHDVFGADQAVPAEAVDKPYVDASQHDFVDLTHLNAPDPAPAVNPHPLVDATPAPPAMDLNEDVAPTELVTAAACLQMIISVLPDISVDYALQFVADRTQDATRTPEACQQIISDLLDGEPYPKEEEEASRKRKRQSSLSEFEEDHGKYQNPGYRIDAIKLLQDEFLNIPARHIKKVFHGQESLFKAYRIIEEQARDNSGQQRHFTPISEPRPKRAFEAALINRGSQLPKELEAAKRKCEEAAAKRHKAEKEEDNLRQAMLSGNVQECACCCEEIPLNRTVCCDGKTVHFFCKACVKTYVEHEVGLNRCQPVCLADPDCGGTFTRTHLQESLGEVLFDRLEHMQQMKDLEIAGLKLDECPFCDFKQECPPIEEDSEFRCLHPKCKKTSCRLCQRLTHVPLSCEENNKDVKITVRHIVEEAMTAALIRNCNNCKRPFIKEAGCNKMTCPNCRHLQCYVCSATITNYDHFYDNGGRGKCPLHDNIEIRHEEEVQKAADEAMAKAKAENPDLSDADIMVQVSDSVKQAEQKRMGRAHMQGNRPRPGVRQYFRDPGPRPGQVQADPFAEPEQNPYGPPAVRYPHLWHPPGPRPNPYPPIPADDPDPLVRAEDLYPPIPADDPYPDHQQQPYIQQPPPFAVPVGFPPPPGDLVQPLPAGLRLAQNQLLLQQQQQQHIRELQALQLQNGRDQQGQQGQQQNLQPRALFARAWDVLNRFGAAPGEQIPGDAQRHGQDAPLQPWAPGALHAAQPAQPALLTQPVHPAQPVPRANQPGDDPWVNFGARAVPGPFAPVPLQPGNGNGISDVQGDGGNADNVAADGGQTFGAAALAGAQQMRERMQHHWKGARR